jgi:penicillin-binding protein 1C
MGPARRGVNVRLHKIPSGHFTAVPQGKIPTQRSPLPAHHRSLVLTKNRQILHRYDGPRWARNVFAAMFTLLVIGSLIVGCGASFVTANAAVNYGERALNQNTISLPSLVPLDTGIPQTATITASDGTILAQINDRRLGERRAVTLKEIAPELALATIAVEDRRFYNHPGVDAPGMLRALTQNFDSDGAGMQGASTLEMQLVRNLFLTDERSEQTLSRKIKEAKAAVELDKYYSKEEILQTYLNVVYYGNQAYGAEAAAQTYFARSARDLTLAQSALLAGLPNAPSTLDPYRNPAGARERQERILGLMVEATFITQQQADEALQERLVYRASPVNTTIAPHWVNYVQGAIRERFGPDALYTAGLRIETTIDMEVQAMAEKIVADAEPVRRLARANNSSMVVIDPRNGHLLAMVGSKNFWDNSIDGQVNLAVAGRQPGSSIKPLVYMTSFEHGLNPATELDDRITAFSAPPGQPPYMPRNYEDKYYGRTTIRDAIGNSLNVPAVKVLKYIGVPAFKDMADRLGVRTLDDWDPRWLSLTLGGGEVRLVEMVGAYATIAREGRYLPIEPLKLVETARGEVLHKASANPEGTQVVDPRIAYQMLHIMGDPSARLVTFGAASPLNLRQPHMVKTGTTDDYHDTWTIGCVPQVCVGVWMGNTQNQPMVKVSSSLTAGKMWVDMIGALTDKFHYEPEAWPVPDGIVFKRIPNVGGTRPGQRDHEEAFIEGHEERGFLNMNWQQPD